MNSVYNKHGEMRTLGTLLAKGGEGEIFPLVERDIVLVKRYLPDKLAKSQKELTDKVEAMRSIREKFPILKKAKNISWVQFSVYDKHNKWLGYAMRRIDGQTLHSLADTRLYKKYAPWLTSKDVAKIMLSWLKTIEMLHKHNVMIGDYNLHNFMWNPRELTAGFIDCDSYQVEYESKFYPCLVGSADMTAPEHQGVSFRDVKRTKESEYFSIAIILFMCLMKGKHPYDMIGGSEPAKNIKNGTFPYDTNKYGTSRIPKGMWFENWKELPEGIKKLFVQTFSEGALQPKKRATTHQWISELDSYIEELEHRARKQSQQRYRR